MKGKKTVKFRSRLNINFGLILLLILMIYLCFHLVSFLTKDRVPVYEVQAGTIVKNHEFEALCLRKERIVTAPSDGYVFYYAGNKSHVSLYAPAVGIDTAGVVAKEARTERMKLSDLSPEAIKRIATSLDSFSSAFDPSAFDKVYSYRADLIDELEETFQSTAAEKLQGTIQAAADSGSYTALTPEAPGFLLYSMDGGEGVTLENWNGSSFSMGKYKAKDLRTDKPVSKGAPLYRLITDEAWDLVIPVDDETASEVKTRSSIRIRFTEDKTTARADLTEEKKGGRTYLILHLKNSMERFASYRFLDVELLINETSGLKIPNSSITEKTFYAIPKSYFRKGDDKEDEYVLLIQKEGKKPATYAPDIFTAGDRTDYWYVDDPKIREDTVLLKPDSDETLKAGKYKAKMNGVYCINKGYAVFRKIDTIYKSHDYSVIRSDTEGGVLLYDHIALTASKVKEDQITY